MRIAIVGCGQLSRMLALAGLPLGIKFSFIKDTPNQDTSCVDGLGPVVPLVQDWQTTENLQALYNELGNPDCITVEKEQVDINLLRALKDFCPLSPNAEAVFACQHRKNEKELLSRLAIPTSPWHYCVTAAKAMEDLSLPLVVKSCSDGYDGKNQWILKTPADVENFDNLDTQDYIIEAWIKYDREISLVSARGNNGEIKHYELTENTHKNGILVKSIAPATALTPAMSAKAHSYMESLMTDMNYVGVMAMECFVVGDELIINELAPRVHNSGHWTQMGSVTCQFENHVRAIAHLPLGSTQRLGEVGMINLIGTEAPTFSLLTPTSKLYWYNKSVRPGRKLGHVNFLSDSLETLQKEMAIFMQDDAYTATCPK